MKDFVHKYIFFSYTVYISHAFNETIFIILLLSRDVVFNTLVE